MSLFGKKTEPPPTLQTYLTNDDSAATSRPYGVGDLIRLMKTIPIDHHPDLVVRVIKTTLESVGVQSSAVVEDALRQEGAIRERIGVLEGDIDGLTREIQDRRDQIAQLQIDLSETIYAKERLQSTENVILPPTPGDVAQSSKPRTLPPPLPPPHKSSSGEPPEPITGT